MNVFGKLHFRKYNEEKSYKFKKSSLETFFLQLKCSTSKFPVLYIFPAMFVKGKDNYNNLLSAWEILEKMTLLISNPFIEALSSP